MGDTADLGARAREMFEAYGRGDLEAMRSILAEDMVSWITNAEGDVDRVEGREGFMSRLPDTSEAIWSTEVTQTLTIDAERAMTAVEVKAERKGKTLHNFAAFLARFAGDQIAELWMVEARPAYSDEFWS